MDRACDRVRDLLRRRPDVAEVDLVAGVVLAERLREQVDVHPARERVGDDERRRGEVVRLHLGVDPGLEVAVAREHGADHEVALRDGDGDLLRQRARVSDAGRAAVADGVEAELLEVVRQAGAVVVLGHDLRPGREARLDPGLAAEAALDRLLRQQAGSDHHLRVRRVRARGDRGDHDSAVLERVVGSLDRHALPAGADDGDGSRVGNRLGRSARCLLGGRIARREGVGDGLVVAPVLHRVLHAERAERVEERRLGVRERNAVLRAARPCERRLDGREIEFQHLGVRRLLARVVPEHVLLAVRLDEREPLLAAAGQAQVAQGRGRRRGRSRRSRRTRATCSRSSRDPRAAARRARARSTPRTSRPLPPGAGSE